MFQLTLRLGGVEVEQHADAARDAVGDRDLRGAEQGNVAPAEQARGSRGILGCEIRGRGEDRALYLLGLEAVRILERAQQLGGSVQDRLAGVGRGGGGAAQSTQSFAHGTRWSVALDGDHGRGRSQGARSGRGVPPGGCPRGPHDTGGPERCTPPGGGGGCPGPRGAAAGGGGRGAPPGGGAPRRRGTWAPP